MSIRDAIAVMKAKGLDPSDILDIVEAMAVCEASEGKEKTPAAVRQARYRERKMNAASVTSDVTSVTRDVTHSTDTNVTSDVTNVTSDVTRYAPSLSIDKKKKREREQASRIAPDWRPVDSDFSYALSKGLSAVQVEREAEKFRNHFVATGKRYFDWSKAWQNWVLRAADFIGCQPVAVPAKPIEVAPQFETEEAFQEWWQKRRAGA